MAVVAEYRGVVLIHISVWALRLLAGENHPPESAMYIIRHTPRSGIDELLGLPTEASAKAFLDERSPDELKDFVSLCELAKRAGLSETARRMFSELEWEWDEEQQAFVEAFGRIEVIAEVGMGKTLLPHGLIDSPSHPLNRLPERTDTSR